MKMQHQIIKANRKGVKGAAAVLLSATCFAGASILFKIAFRLGLTPEQAVALQSWFASLILLAFAVHRKIWDKCSLNKSTMVILVFQGLAGCLGTSIIYAYSLLYLPVSVAILLLYLYPVFVLTAGVLLWHKRISVPEIIALLFTLAGTVLASGVLSGVGTVSLQGIVLGLSAAVCYAIFNLTGEAVLKRVSPLVSMSFCQWFTSLGLLLLLRENTFRIPWQSSSVWILAMVLATVASILPFYLMLVGIKFIGSDKASILSTFELPITFVLAALFLREFPEWKQWAGGGLVLAGIILLNWRGISDETETN